MSRIHFLPVKYGDSFVIECDKNGHHGVVVVDGGPTGCSNVLQDKVNETGTPDLMVLTHYDDDHIGGLSQYINGRIRKGDLPAKEVWANCAGYAEVEEPALTKSALQGVKLSKVLNDQAGSGKLEWRDDLIEGVAKEFPFASIEVVSPTAEGRRLAVGKQEIAAVKVETKSTDTEEDQEEPILPLEALAEDCPKPPSEKADAEVANAASIAFILRCDGLSVLMLGDCYPHNVVAYLRSKGYSEANPLAVDFVKVAHHGSRHNTNNELLDLVKCNHYLFSTNGDKFGHPDRESLAHILCHPTRDRNEKVHLYFNSDLVTLFRKSGRFILDGEPEAYNFEVHENTAVLPEKTAGLAAEKPVPKRSFWKRFFSWLFGRR